MSGCSWYMLKIVLEHFDVRTSWPSSDSPCMKFTGTDGRSVIIYKSNNIKSDIIEWVVKQLEISMDDFKAAYDTVSKQ